MRRAMGFILVLSILALGLSGCTVTAADEVMKAPSFNLSAFDTWQDQMKHLSLAQDIKKIGHDWALAISGPERLTLQVFDGKQETSKALELGGDMFYSASAKDLNGDGIEEIFVNFEHAIKGPQLIVWDVTHLDQPLFNGAYSTHALASLKGTLALYTIGSEKINDLEESYVYEISLADFSVKEKVNVGFLYGAQMLSGKLKDGRDAVFFSGGVGAHSAVSDAIILNPSGTLEPLFYKPDGEIDQPYTAYSAELKDVNQDGIIEFPFMDPSPYQTDSSMAGTIWLTRYTDYFEGNFETISVYHETYYGSLKMNPEWVANWAITRNDYQETGIWYTYTDQKSGEELVTISYLDDLALKAKLLENDALEIISENKDFTAVAQWGEQVDESLKVAIKANFLINPIATLTR